MSLLQRLRRAVVTVPARRDWIEAGGALLGLAAVLGPAGLATGLLIPGAKSLPDMAAGALLAFFIPALGEELIFRAPIPDRSETTRAAGAIALSTIAFIAWHGLETLWLPGAADLFLRPEFLAAAGLIGLACAVLRRRSGSIWTAVALHWIVVVVWQAWLGGPGVSELR